MMIRMTKLDVPGGTPLQITYEHLRVKTLEDAARILKALGLLDVPIVLEDMDTHRLFPIDSSQTVQSVVHLSTGKLPGKYTALLTHLPAYPY